MKTRGGLLIDFGLTHEILAAMVGVTRPFLTVTLKDLERKGLVRSERRRIVIVDPARLQASAGDRVLPASPKAGKNRRARRRSAVPKKHEVAECDAR